MKSISRKARKTHFRKALVYFLTFCLAFQTWVPALMALEAIDIVNSSGIAPTQWGDHTIIDAGHGAIIDWQNFDTAAGQSVKFNQYDALGGALSSSSAVLNRITSANATQFDGALTANGNVFIVNPAGIMFGSTATVNVTQLIASSLDITNENFLAENYEFIAGEGAGEIVNFGTIDAAQGAALIGKRILNAGTISTGDGGFVVMAAGSRVLLGNPGSQILVEMDSVAASDADGYISNESTGSISAPSGTVVLAAGDIFSTTLNPDSVRVQKGVGTIVQSGRINADGKDYADGIHRDDGYGNGGSVILTAGDRVTLSSGSLTTANGGISNITAKGGSVIADASELYIYDAIVDFQAGARIEVRGGSPSDATVLEPEATVGIFDGGLAEVSGDHLFFNGSVDAVSIPFQVPDPANPGDTITITPDGGTLFIDPYNLTLANGGIPEDGAAVDTFYEEEIEAYSNAGVDTILQGDHGVTVEHMNDGVIEGGSGDIVLRTTYNNGGIEFLPETEGGPITTTVRTVGGGNIFLLTGSKGIKTGNIETRELGSVNPGRIRIFTNNGGDIETRALTVDGGNDVEVSVIASGNLMIDGNVITRTNKVPDKLQKIGLAQICLVSENGDVTVLGAVDVEAHGKEETIANIHICAERTVTVAAGNGRVRAVAKTSTAGTADADIRIHAGSDEPDAISVTNNVGSPIRLQSHTSAAQLGPVDFTGEVVEHEESLEGSHLFLQIADAWLSECSDCPTPPNLLPPLEPPGQAPIAVSDNYVIGKNDILIIIIGTDGVLVDGSDGYGADFDPDGTPGDTLIAILIGGGSTSQGGTVVLQDDGSFEYTPPEKVFDDGYGTDGDGDYALFTDTFSYYIEDLDGLSSNEASVTITSKNYIPLAQPDSYDVTHNTNLSPGVEQGIIAGAIPAINGDSDADGDVLTPFLPGNMTTGTTDLGGTVTLNPDGSFVYTPPADTVATDSFTYYVSDGFNNSETVEVTIDLTNTKPVANPDFYDVSHNVTLDVTDVASGTIEGIQPDYADSDPDPGDVLSAFVEGDGSTALGGSVVMNTDGTFTYTPPVDTVGQDSFTYYVTDGYENSESVQVTIDLTNLQPIAQADTYEATQNAVLSPTADQGIIVGLTSDYSDYDPDGDTLTPLLSGDITQGPTDQGGLVTLNPDGSFTYEPPTDWYGADTFSYYVSDGYEGGISEPVQVTILVAIAEPAAVTSTLMAAAPGLARVEFKTSGCPALMKWAADELGAEKKVMDFWVADSLASDMAIQPCDAFGRLREAAIILQDTDGLRITALGQVISEFASSDAPLTEENMASIIDAITNNVENNPPRILAGEYLDALAQYVSVLSGELDFSRSEALQLVVDNHIVRIANDASGIVAAFVSTALTTLGGK